MSLDVVNQKGVLFRTEDVILRLFPADLKAVGRAVRALRNTIADMNCSIYPPSGDISKSLDDIKDKSGMVEWLMNAIQVNLDAGTDGYSDDMALHTIWDALIKAFPIKGLPSVEFHYFPRDREAEDDVPLEVPCISFTDDDLFVSKLSPEGRRLARILGVKTLKVSSWTILSY
ncbi:MAG TPA: hypothetical protein PKE12_09800 [Kiritimatiellia bacterium]|nr:hypothetical protein [Kiritimatiellia bacterium]